MRERVESLGGSLDRDTHEGTRIRITLPVGRAGESQPVTPGSRDNRRIRVVIAEDQGMVLGALAALLEIEGAISVVARARDGKEALESTLAHKPDVFITDIEMPRMSGRGNQTNAR